MGKREKVMNSRVIREILLASFFSFLVFSPASHLYTYTVYNAVL